MEIICRERRKRIRSGQTKRTIIEKLGIKLPVKETVLKSKYIKSSSIRLGS